jgi:hypothetical protein
VVIRVGCNRPMVKDQLRESFATSLCWLRERRVAIEALVAVGYTDAGRELLIGHGFQVATELEAELQGAALLAGGRHVYRLIAEDRPTSRPGRQLHEAAFGRVAGWPDLSSIR